MIVAFVPFLLSYPLFYILTANKKWFPLAHQYRRIWGNLICFLAGLRKKVTFEEPLDTNRVYIIAPNHCSYLDIVSTTCDIPIYFNYMANEATKSGAVAIILQEFGFSYPQKSNLFKSY